MNSFFLLWFARSYIHIWDDNHSLFFYSSFFSIFASNITVFSFGFFFPFISLDQSVAIFVNILSRSFRNIESCVLVLFANQFKILLIVNIQIHPHFSAKMTLAPNTASSFNREFSMKTKIRGSWFLTFVYFDAKRF